MRAAGYIRVSTEEQAREGYGLAAQEEAVRAYCRAQRWELAGMYSDAGRSGKSTAGRDGLARLLADARAGLFDRGVFWKLDRLGRNLRDLLAICDGLEAAGVGVVSIQESIDTGTATGRMMRNMLGVIAEFERDVITDRIKAGLEQKARQGELLGHIPLGYRRDDSGRIVPDPVTASLVRAMFERYATAAYSLRDMVPWCGSVGLRSIWGNPLDRLSIRKVLSNLSYTGQVGYRVRSGGGILANGRHPAIVDAVLFARVQDVLAQHRMHDGGPRPYGKEPYPLTGVSVCGACGSPMLGTARIIEHRWRYRYMRCSVAARQGASACVQPMVRAEHLEEQLRDYIAGMRLSAEDLGRVVAELRRRQQRQEVSPNEVQSLRREISRWQRLFTLGEIEEADYRREASTIRRRLAELDRPAQVLDVERAVHLLRDVAGLWACSTRRQQREFVRAVFLRIVVQGKALASIMPRAEYAPLFVVDRRERFGGGFVQTGSPGRSLAPPIAQIPYNSIAYPALVLPPGCEAELALSLPR